LSEKIDVLIVTFNCSKTLRKCLKSIKEAVPYNRILVGDGGSSDGTIEIAQSEGAEVHLFTGKDNKIGRIRYKLAERAETPWLLYVDSDVYLYPHFWRVMRHTMKPSVGMSMAAQDAPPSVLSRYFEWRNKRFRFVTFSNTLVPRDLILSCRELLNVHVGEDAVYARFAKSRGYDVLAILYRLSYHDKGLDGVDKAFERWGRDLAMQRRFINLAFSELIHIRNIFWYAIDEGVRKKEIFSLLRNSWFMLKGFFLGLRT